MIPVSLRWERVGMILGIAAAEILMSGAGWPLAATGAQPETDGGYVLLSMEQARTYQGKQEPGSCSGTAPYSQCVGLDITCGAYCDPATCNGSVARIYPASPPTYCTNWAPLPPGTATHCDFRGQAVCYTWHECQWTGEPLNCCGRKNWESHESLLNNDVCIFPSPPPPPPGQG